MNRPLALVCYICGREFGTKSLGIHIKACEKKWENQQSLKPPKERRPCPKAPAGLQQLLNMKNITKKDIIDFNNGSFNTFKEQALMECEYCGRKFNPKSLEPHQKACKTNPMIRKPYIPKGKELENNEQKENLAPVISSKGYNLSNINSSYNEENVNLQQCSKCGRKFATERLSKHEKVCKGAQVKKAPKIIEKLQIKQASKPNLKKGSAPNNSKQPQWKNQSQNLRNAMKQMRKLKEYQANGGDISKLPPPPPSNYDHYIPCKYCGRKYAPDVAEKHIPKCANIINKPGGIKPSTIQQKYIAGTGAKSKIGLGSPNNVQKSSQQNLVSSPLKPKLVASKLGRK